MSQMTRITTPTNVFTLPDTMTSLSNFVITYQQNGRPVLVKKMGDDGVTFSGHTITVELTQTDTRKFISDVKMVCKVKVKTTAGKVMDSDFISIDIHETLYKEDM